MSDLIDRQQAIKAVELGITYAKLIDTETGELLEPFKDSNDELKRAVQRIKNLPSAQPTFDARDTQYNLPIGTDLISRAQAIAMCRKPCMRNADCSDFEMEIMMLPSAQPEPSQVARDIARIVENEKDMRVIAQPEIIRCKDCKYWDTTWQNDYAPNYHYCPMIDGTHRNDFYCAYAERRTDG